MLIDASYFHDHLCIGHPEAIDEATHRYDVGREPFVDDILSRFIHRACLSVLLITSSLM